MDWNKCKVSKSENIILIQLHPDKTPDKTLDFDSLGSSVSVRVFFNSFGALGIRVKKKPPTETLPFPHEKLSERHSGVAEHIFNTESLIASYQLAKELLECVTDLDKDC